MGLHKTNTPRLWTLVNSDSGILHNLIQQVTLLKYIDQKLGSFLGKPLCDHCTIANFANETLLLHADTPAWASRLRYNTPQIMLFMQNECGLESLRTIRVKVTPATFPSIQLPGKRWKLDQHTADMIYRTASTMTDETLKHTLLRISKHS